MFKKKRKREFLDRLKNGMPPPPPEMQWRSVVWNWNAKEGYALPMFGRQTTSICITLFFGIFAIRFRGKNAESRFGNPLPRKIFVRYHPIYFEKCDLD